MAHEILKFKVQVDDIKNWQPIYGNQEHGTFYMVYIKFKSVEQKEGKYLYTVDFKLQNYVGSITMGFSGAPKLKQLNPDELEANKELIKKEIERINSERKTPLIENEVDAIYKVHQIDFQLEIPVKPFCNNFEYKSVSLDALSIPLKGNVLNAKSDLGNPDPILYNPDEEKALNSLYINPYHYERAGDELTEIGRKSVNDGGDFTSVNTGGTYPLTICIPSRSFLI